MVNEEAGHALLPLLRARCRTCMLGRGGAGVIERYFIGGYLYAGAYHLYAAHDQAITRLETIGDQPVIADRPVGGQDSKLYFTVGVDHQGGRLAFLVVRHALLRR